MLNIHRASLVTASFGIFETIKDPENRNREAGTVEAGTLKLTKY